MSPRTIELERQFNKHHSMWPRRDFRNGFDRRFRNTTGLVVATPIINHNQLHAHMLPPIKPTRDMMECIIHELDVTNVAQQHERWWGVETAATAMHRYSQTEPSYEIAEQARDLSHHLEQQIGYLAIKLPMEVY